MKRKPTRPKKRVVPKPRYCYFDQEGLTPDYKNPEILSRFISERGKILSADKTGLCPKHQRKLSFAVKRARFLGLLPFIVGVK
ncbi:MAG: 30S ribosomal protein S18 [bacterium]|nr:30S ribosomal protein S18 [bacterium]